MKLYIIRHAETEYNRKGIIQGSEVDSDINDIGESQANSFYEYYKDINFDKIYVSGLKRTFQTIRRFTENGSSYEKLKEFNEQVKATKKVIKEKTQILKSKKADLEALSGESQEEEKKLDALKAKAAKKVEPSLLLSYEKLVERQRNGLAIVKVSRGACGGCFNVVPAQRQAEIKEKKKIILCEYCGRILADVIAEEVVEKPKKRTSRKKAAPKKATTKKAAAKK